MDYLAPEQISRRGCTTKADVWALGILTYRMLCGNLPFEHLSAWELCARITRGSVQYPTHLSMEAQNFMESLLCVDEASRLSCEEALKHPFIVGSSCSLHEASAETELPSAVSFQCSPTPEHWDNRLSACRCLLTARHQLLFLRKNDSRNLNRSSKQTTEVVGAVVVRIVSTAAIVLLASGLLLLLAVVLFRMGVL
ncbi:hypothetical protein TcYC6_0024000 [Trypanosoma cruzi]|nr:hypothetical protein TcYC6_0024000 [Trypanosoma cruzi]